MKATAREYVPFKQRKLYRQFGVLMQINQRFIPCQKYHMNTIFDGYGAVIKNWRYYKRCNETNGVFLIYIRNIIYRPNNNSNNNIGKKQSFGRET